MFGYAANETDTLMPYAGVVAPPESWGTADFALQLISLLLILLSLGAASYFAYKRRQELRKSYQDFAAQTDREQRGWNETRSGSCHKDG